MRATPPPAPWWGDTGPAPHVRWSGVTVEIPAVWSTGRGRWESPDGRYYFDAEAADRACEFFPTFLAHHIGEHAGKSFDLLDYQRCLIVRPVFGWKSADDGLRRFRFVFAFIPKGNGKSPLGSGLSLFLTLCDDEPAAEVYAVAGDKDQAKIVHDAAKIMVEGSADLQELCEVYRDSIYNASSKSFCKVIASDAAGNHGFRPHGVIFDEFHNQRNRDLYEALRKSMVKRRQPVIFMFSHAGDDDESICFEEYEYARALLSGSSRDDSCLPVVFEPAKDDDDMDEATWRRVNPGYGVTINPKIFAAEALAAANEPRKKNDFLRFNLNKWVGSASAWMVLQWWDDCRRDFTDADLQGLTVTAGMDCAQKIDLFAFVLTFRRFLEQAVEVEVKDVDEATGKETAKLVSLNFEVFTRPYFWLPEATMKERAKEGVAYESWAKAGLLRVTEGATIDYDRVYRDITQEIVPAFPLLKEGEIGYDPAFATDIAGRLRDKAGLKVVEVLQNYKYMNEPAQVFEGLVRSKRIAHDGHRLMRWCVENTAVKRDDAGRIRPVKPKSPKKKIDGLVGGLMGLHRLLAIGEAGSVYDHRASRGEEVIRWV